MSRLSAAALCFGLASAALPADIAEVLPLDSRTVMLRVTEGHVVHHVRGQKRSDEQVVVDPLDVAAATSLGSYRVSSADDPAYKNPVAPSRIARKSKGTDFAWFVDRWVNGRAENDRPDHVKTHWLYLQLPRPMASGKTYTIATGNLAKNGQTWKLRFAEGQVRSEAVHVNLLGYRPDVAAKFGYVYHWMGDAGSMDVSGVVGKRFRLVDGNGKTAFQGKVAFRKPATNQETYHVPDSPPVGNFLNAEVAECDFSAFVRPGAYRLVVDGVGSSFPFRIGADAYREAYRVTARGLYHNRSGIALERPYTEFVRPAPHNPKLTPGFAGKLVYTTSRYLDWSNQDAAEADKAAIEAGIKGPLDAWGWYQDAGDWDSYSSHLRVAQELLFAFEAAPGNFVDGDLGIPESGNGLPDILDEAAWLPRFCHRLRQELMAKGYGTGGLGLRVCGDHFGGDTGPQDVGRGSWEDVDRTWIASGEDPFSTYRYAGTAAHLAHCLGLIGKTDPMKVDWAKEAREAYAWAAKNTLPKDEDAVRTARSYASANLFRLTGDKAYEEAFRKDVVGVTPTTDLWEPETFGPYAYALGGGKAKPDLDLLERMRAALLHTADTVAGVADRRALRWGGNWSFPMLVGHQTTPWALECIVGHVLTRESDPALSRRYLQVVATTADYFLGTNALNQTWVTGLGPRFPNQVFHMDAWYNGKPTPHPGIIPYGPWRKSKDLGIGPWDEAWPHKTLYPSIDAWPGNERWFDNRCAPMTGEFTVHQNTGPAAALYGFLAGPAKASTTTR